MKSYEVTLPITGFVALMVEAESSKEAIQIGLDTYLEEQLVEWSAVEKIVEGNVCYAQPSHAYAEEVDY